jgi:pyruvate/2-oxoglutarate dehydrogenase complex dihydrolipoamide dehydrogenase (E3) component
MIRHMAEHYDVVAIGGGTGGITAAKLARAAGARVALVDRERLGGDCLHTGCVPTKTMVASAKLFHDIKRAEMFGIKVGPPEIDFAGFMARKQAVIDEIQQTESPEVFEVLGIDVLFGPAHFESPHELRVDKGLIEAGKFVIAAGSSPKMPQELAAAGALSNIELLQLTQLPKSLIIVGGGPIGTEFAQIFQRIGCQVTQVHPGDHILPKEDRELGQALAKILAGEDIRFEARARVTRAWREDGLVHAELSSGKQLSAEQMLVAAGRTPNVQDLALEKAGVACDERGVKVNEELRTSASHIWACGDVIGGYLFTHVADEQARTIAANLQGKHKKWADRVVPWTTFTDPELARVGLTETEARAKYGNRIKVLRWPFRKIDRALCEGEPEGLIKLITAPGWLRGRLGGEIVGVHILGERAGELLHEFLPIMRARLPVGLVAWPIHVYPTLSVGVRASVGQLFTKDI